jgi:hypothetical protein
MLDIDIRDDEEQDHTTGIQAHDNDLQVHATDLREEEKEWDDQGQLPRSR